MPEYEFICDCGETASVICSMADAPETQKCNCGEEMQRVFSFAVGNKDYAKPLHSDSLAINPEQAEEHRQHFPNTEIDSQGRPVFHNYQEHDKYLKKAGFVKMSKKSRRRGVKIA